MKKLIFFCCIYLLANSMNAQIMLGFNLGPQLPQNSNFKTNYKTGFGISASGKYAVSDSRLYGLTVSYAGWGPKSPAAILYDYRVSATTFALGREDYFNDDRLRLYSIVEGALMFQNLKSSRPDFETQSSNFIGVNVGAGLLFQVQDRLYVSAAARLHVNYGISEFNLYYGTRWFSYIGMNFGVVYRLGD